jgi:hypothetical protein
MLVVSTGWNEGSRIGAWEKSAEKSGEDSGVNSDKGQPFVVREKWGGSIVACGGGTVNG